MDNSSVEDKQNDNGQANHTDSGQDLRSAAPGYTLRTAREATGRELEDFSAELNIGKDHLASIEENQFDDMGGPTFVKGYIRAYARALGLDSEPLIEAYLGHQIEIPVVTTREKVAYERHNGLGVLIGSAVIAMAIVAALTIWFMDSDDSKISASSEEDIAAQTSTVVDSEPSAGQWIDEAPPLNDEVLDIAARNTLFTPGLNATDTVQKIADTDKTESDPESDQESNTKSEQAAGLVADETATKEKAPAEESKPELAAAATKETNTAPPVVDKSSVAVVEERKPAKIEASVSETKKQESQQRAQNNAFQSTFIGEGSDRVSLVLSEDSWVEVQDSSGEMILQGLFNAGATRDIQGTAPFQVFLGNAPGVEIQFNGQYFDTGTLTRQNNTARFALVKP